MSVTIKLPVILFLKNRLPILIVADMGASETHEDFDNMIYPQLSEGITKDDVVKVTCFCSICQTDFSLQLNIVFSQLHELLELYPPDLLLKFVPTQEEAYSGLSNGWPFLQHLVNALTRLAPFMKAAQTAAIEWQSVNKS